MTARPTVLAVLFTTVLLSGRAGSAEQPSPVADEVRQLAVTHGTVRVLVHLDVPFVPDAELQSVAQVAGQRQTIAAAQAFVKSGLSGVRHRVAREPRGLPFLAVEVDADGLRALEAQRGVVRHVEEDRLERPHLSQSVPLIRADAAWTDAGVDGSGTIVAVLDTGVDKNHAFFGDRVIHEACFSTTTTISGLSIFSVCPGGADAAFGNNAGLNCSILIDGCDHGTHVAGIAAGGTTNVLGSGVAPGARIMAIQVFSEVRSAGFCFPFASCVAAFQSDILEALNYVYTMRDSFLPDHVIAAVNMSLGGAAIVASCPTDPRKPAVDQLRAAGIATVIASGNEGRSGAISPPACIPTAVSVGATTKQDEVAFYSNSASTLSLLAPGGAALPGVPAGDILSSVPGNDFDFKAGTSMATPHVAGAFALLREAHPAASVDVLLSALKASGVPVLDTRNGRVKPRIDARAAIDAAKGDLVVTLLTGPTKISGGATYTLSYALRNTGPTSVNASVLGVFLSTDPTITTDDVALGSAPVPLLGPGSKISGSLSVVVPDSAAPGTVFFGAVANVDGAADEATEGNNSRASAAALLVRPDYLVQSVTTGVGVSMPGSNVSVTQIIKNVAPAPNYAPASMSRIFLSDDTVLDGGDVSLGTVAVPSIGAGKSATVSRSVQVPPGTAVGRYWVFVRANDGDTIVEGGSGANVGRTSNPLIVGPDLTPTAATPTRKATAPGMTVGVAAAVKNQGGQAAGAFDITVSLSMDPALDPADVSLGTRRVSGLAAGQTFTGPIVVTIPPGQAPGQYFLLVRADAGGGATGEVVEADETNNERATVVVRVVQPDLAMVGLTATPLASGPGMNVTVTQTVKNLAALAGKAGPTTSQLSLSADGVLDGGDVVLLDVPIPALAGGATATVKRSVQIPETTAVGKYFIVARANAVDPTAENDPTSGANNVRAIATPVLVGPDLVVTAATAGTRVRAGMNVSVATTIKNRGGQGAPATSRVRFFLAQTGAPDVLLGATRPVAALAPGAVSGPIATQVTIPSDTEPGTYSIRVQADGDDEVDEADDTNNSRTTTSFTVAP